MSKKPVLRTPFFEIGIKNYLYGDDVLAFARTVDAAAHKYDIDVLLITPITEIRRVKENTERLLVFAPYMDLVPLGAGVAAVLPEAIKAAGASGVILNHCERPMPFPVVAQLIARAKALGILSLVSADSIAEGQAIAFLHPDMISPEPTELIGGTQPSDLGYIQKTIEAIKTIDPSIIVEPAAGITRPEQVYDLILSGAEGVGSASGIFNAGNPCAMAEAMIRSVREAQNELANRSKREVLL